MTNARDRWSDGAQYERYIGRWSRLVARELLAWIAVPWRSNWLDVGCGTGALTQTILARWQPGALLGVDRSPTYVATAATPWRCRFQKDSSTPRSPRWC